MKDDILSDDFRGPPSLDRPVCRPEVYEDVAQGARELHRALREAPSHLASAGTVLISPRQPSEAIYALRRGWACRVRQWPGGRRAVPEIYVPGDLIGLEAALQAKPSDAVVALQAVSLQTLDADALPGLLARHTTAAYLAWLTSEAQRRAERRADWIARLDGKERLAALLVDLHERLRRRELVTAGSFNLPVTQQQIGDHVGLTVVHVNRMLRELREEKIAIVDRHVVIIRDMARLRRLASGGRAGADATTPESVIERPPRPMQPEGAEGEAGAVD